MIEALVTGELIGEPAARQRFDQLARIDTPIGGAIAPGFQRHDDHLDGQDREEEHRQVFGRDDSSRSNLLQRPTDDESLGEGGE